MLVELIDGKCRSCGGQLEIAGVDDATMDVECTECGDGYTVEGRIRGLSVFGELRSGVAGIPESL